MTGRRGLLVAVLLCAVGAVVALVALGRPWVHEQTRARTPSADRPDAFVETTTTRNGADLAPGARALALVSLAGAAALVAARGRGRTAVGITLVAAGGGTAYLAAEQTADATTLAAPVCAVAGVLVAAGGGLAVLAGRRWPALGARYDGPGTAVAPAPRDPLADAWDAVDRGDDVDPTGSA